MRLESVRHWKKSEHARVGYLLDAWPRRLGAAGVISDACSSFISKFTKGGKGKCVEKY